MIGKLRTMLLAGCLGAGLGMGGASEAKAQFVAVTPGFGLSIGNTYGAYGYPGVGYPGYGYGAQPYGYGYGNGYGRPFYGPRPGGYYRGYGYGGYRPGYGGHHGGYNHGPYRRW